MNIYELHYILQYKIDKSINNEQIVLIRIALKLILTGNINKMTINSKNL